MILYHNSWHPILKDFDIIIINTRTGENNMAKNQKTYDSEFKAQAVKLAQEIGGHKAAKELGIPKGTMYTWIRISRLQWTSESEHNQIIVAISSSEQPFSLA